MKRADKIIWMLAYAERMHVKLELNGSIGFGRECVGVLFEGSYVEYRWYDNETYKPLDKNGDVWRPDDAYHKGDYVAVLGTGIKAENQLYKWLKFFDSEGFHLETGSKTNNFGPIGVVLGHDRFARFVRNEPVYEDAGQ